MTSHRPVLSLHELLTKTDVSYWSEYWQTTSGEISNYPQYIATLTDAIIALKIKRLFIISDDRAYFLAALLAALHAGIPAVLPPLATAAAITELLQQHDGLASNQIEFANLTPLFIFVGATPRGCPSLTWPQKTGQPRGVAPTAKIIFYTSGSTGAPKPIEKSLAQLETEVAMLHQIWGSAHPDIMFLSTVAHHHIYGLLFSLLWPVCAGYHIARTTFSFWQDIVKAIKMRDTHYYIISSPAHLGRFHVTAAADKSATRVFSSGGVLSYDAAQATLEFLGILPIEVYGSTETGGIAYRQQHTTASVCVWTRFNNILLRQDAQQRLCIQSPYLPHHDWYQTEDQVTLLNQDQFYLSGRTDRIVKVAGKRVSLLEQEQKLMTFPSITDAAVLLLANTTRDELGAIIVLSESGQAEFSRLGKIAFIRKLRHNLSHYFDRVAIPRKWRFVTAILRNTQGKRVDAQLQELFKSN